MIPTISRVLYTEKYKRYINILSFIIIIIIIKSSWGSFKFSNEHNFSRKSA